MVKFYLTKIQNNEINDNTGAVWNVEDVPKLWKLKVKNALKRDTYD